MTRPRPLGTVQAKMSLGATLVVAVALVAAGLAVLLSLRANLTGQAQSQADDTARRVALDVASRGADADRYARLRLPEGAPVQVTTEDGRLLAVSGGLQRISGTGVGAVRAVRVPVATPAPSVVPGRTAEGGDHGGGDDGGHGRGRGRGGRDDAARGGEDDDRHGGGTASPAAGDDPVVGDIGRTVVHGTGRATLDGRTSGYRFATIKATDLAGQPSSSTRAPRWRPARAP